MSDGDGLCFLNFDNKDTTPAPKPYQWGTFTLASGQVVKALKQVLVHNGSLVCITMFRGKTLPPQVIGRGRKIETTVYTQEIPSFDSIGCQAAQAYHHYVLKDVTAGAHQGTILDNNDLEITGYTPGKASQPVSAPVPAVAKK
jgi:hypothetical protein